METLPAIEGRGNAPMNAMVAVGFGSAYVTKDGDMVCDGEQAYQSGKPVTVSEIEEMAAANPDADWRIVYYGPLSNDTYQRQGVGEWVCVDHGDGFA